MELSMSQFATKEEYDFAVAEQRAMKSVVRYTEDCMHFPNIVVGERANVVPVDHPRSYLNGQWCITSPIISVDGDTGNFETENTRYVKVVS